MSEWCLAVPGKTFESGMVEAFDQNVRVMCSTTSLAFKSNIFYVPMSVLSERMSNTPHGCGLCDYRMYPIYDQDRSGS